MLIGRQMSKNSASLEMVHDREDCTFLSPSIEIARRLYGCDLCERLLSNPRMAGLSLDRQHGHPITFPLPLRTKPVLIARAPMGSGKTTALIDWLTGFLDTDDRSAVIVSCRRSFTNSLSRRFQRDGLTGFTTYLDSNQYVLADVTHRRLMVQLESLQRVSEALLDRYDVLVIDEVMSILAQFFSPTMRRLRLVDALFSSLLRRCKHIIAMDATINLTLIELLADIRGPENIHVVVNDFVSRGFANRECVIMNSLGASMAFEIIRSHQTNINRDEDAVTTSSGSCADVTEDIDEEVSIDGSFFHELHGRLARGENVCVFSSTLAFSRIVAFFCAEIIGKKGVLLLNSTSQITDTTYWNRYKVVVYTTVVTVGLSFDDFHFHSMFAFVKPSIHGPDMMAVYQAIGRVRKLIHDKLFMYLDLSGANGGTTFTPMLLNIELGPPSIWSPEISIPTNLMCLRFKERCSGALLDHQTTLFSKFKTKHYLERSTLTSANDSFSLLHTLLSNNHIAIKVRKGCHEEQLNARTVDEWGGFLARLRADAFSNKSYIKYIAKTADEYEQTSTAPNLMTTSPSDEETILLLSECVAARKFMDRFFGLRGAIDDYEEPILTLLKNIGECPAMALHLVNSAVVEAGCACDIDEWLAIDLAVKQHPIGGSYFDHWLDYYLNEPLVLLKHGRPEETPVASQPGLCGWKSLLRTCINIARQIGWRPAKWDDNKELDVVIIVRAMESALEAGLGKFALEYMRLNFTEPSWITAPIRNLQRLLEGQLSGRRTSKQNICPAIGIFKTLWAELFGVRAIKSQRTFPGSARMKNLRKENLVSLLNQVGVSYPENASHRVLYALLKEHKHLFGESNRLLLRTPDWMGHLAGNKPNLND
ncbi:Replication origin-binding protein [Cacatuid alphaherpesvirus 2]|uniref:Replication origin-binding protein n=1 Tax=Cacatuid alphaherpesvirus 2 TaxID=2604840 RepID=A0A5B9R2J1_9ALPH|nr:Replication origin-binding protein [Cacatuid alphaherpesvirus 2]QEG54044.1 Replication origin-binding protein [Cacatuid alphaherpesvirus 2]